MKFRIGHGYDVHRISPERKMILGGVEIPCGYGLEAHSDGDVLIHALIDALFGACALPDIGAHYPDTDERYKNADSMKLLADCINELDAVGYHVENIDCTVIAQAPNACRIYHRYAQENCRSLPSRYRRCQRKSHYRGASRLYGKGRGNRGARRLPRLSEER